MRWILVLYLGVTLSKCYVTSTILTTMAGVLSGSTGRSYGGGSGGGGGGGSYGSTSYNSYASKPSLGRLIGDKIDGILAFKGMLLGPLMGIASSFMTNKFGGMSYYNAGGGGYGPGAGSYSAGGGSYGAGGAGYGGGGSYSGGGGSYSAGGGSYSAGGGSYSGGGAGYGAGGGNYGAGGTIQSVGGSYTGGGAGYGGGGRHSNMHTVNSGGYSGGASGSYSTNSVKYVRGNSAPVKVRYVQSPTVYEDGKESYVKAENDDLQDDEYHTDDNGDVLVHGASEYRGSQAQLNYGQRTAAGYAMPPPPQQVVMTSIPNTKTIGFGIDFNKKFQIHLPDKSATMTIVRHY